eukprot:CAMPEP_0168191100 /NCGR_PEP_ID=MMETSP0139_2-20121125/17317_1 /TAXON_ID=44445 /ORGANISM="Pseudo-nitzschia australis, Strain 10249 10 AB" /LENGTH=956 /DNA_ID=CAMNT_0008114215 /DNA_START=569 /DNA_END=3439 /DNA_ORIENTATION=+
MTAKSDGDSPSKQTLAGASASSIANANSSSSSTKPSAPPKPEEVINVNVGILGHVDSGKTSLVKTLSTLLSTAALDKSKQSRQRGMTLDLGFSCFFMDLPDRLREQLEEQQNSRNATLTKIAATKTATATTSQLKYLQMTLVDCPGHASLIRTIIGGAQIIDVVLLVVDAYKGWQAQTTECLVLAELTAPHLVIALNKIDMFPKAERRERLEEAKARVRERLRQSKKFSDPDSVPMIGVSACCGVGGGEKVVVAAGGGGGADEGAGTTNAATTAVTNSTANTSTSGTSTVHDLVKQQTINVDKLIDLLKQTMPAPRRHLAFESNNNNNNTNSTSNNGNFYFAIDHCFPIKGMGTVLTGTCLNGSIRVNDAIEFPALGNLQRKIKSMQMFKRKTNSIRQGDRAGICVSNFDATSLERGVCASPGSVKWVSGAIALVKKIVPHYKGAFLKNKSKYHVSVGHSTVMATVSFWGARELWSETQKLKNSSNNGNSNDNGDTSIQVKEAVPAAAAATACLGGDADHAGLPYLEFDWKKDYLLQDGLLESLPNENTTDGTQNNNSNNAMDGTNGGNNNNHNHNNNKTSSKGGEQQEALLHWAIIDFKTPVYCPLQSLVIGSRLDAAVEGKNHRQQGSKNSSKNYKNSAKNSSSNNNASTSDPENGDDPGNENASSCRLAFCGRLIERVDPKEDAKRIRWYTPKEKRGVVARLGDPHKRQDDGKTVRYEVYGGDLFKKETLLRPFLGLKLVTHPGGDVGELRSGFGTSGKFRVNFPAGTTAREGDVLRLPFRRFVNDPEKKMRQDDIALPRARPGSRIDHPSQSSSSGGGKKKKVESTGLVDKVKGDPLVAAAAAAAQTPPPNGGGNDKKKSSLKYPTAIISGLFTPDVDIRQMIGRKIWIPSTREEGTISGPFGKAGKCKVSFFIDNRNNKNDSSSSPSSSANCNLKGISEHAVGAKAELLRP